MAIRLVSAWNIGSARQATYQDHDPDSGSDDQSSGQRTPSKSLAGSSRSKHARRDDKATIDSLLSKVVETRPPEDKYSPAHIAKEFTSLRYSIREIPSLCFSSTSNVQDDTDSTLAGIIALWLHQNIIVGPGPLFQPRFGLPEHLETPLRALESELVSSGRVDKAALREWTLQTFRVTQGQESVLPRGELLRMSKHLSRFIKGSIPEWYFWKLDADQRSITAVVEQAVSLAIMLRSSKIRYEWEQPAPCGTIPVSDFEAVGSYDPELSAHILEFAPVYKVENESKSLLTMGRVVVPEHA